MIRSKFENDLLDLIEKTAEQGLSFTAGAEKQHQFKETFVERIEKRWIKTPWMMRLTLRWYKLLLAFHETRSHKMKLASNSQRECQQERVDSLRFATVFGQSATASERAWFYEQCERYRIRPHDATFMVWARTLCIKKQKIYFGHWDWVCGIFYMLPLLFPVACLICICLSPNDNPFAKATLTLSYIGQIILFYYTYKAQSFDVYEVGSRYFKPNGWRYTPQPTMVT